MATTDKPSDAGRGMGVGHASLSGVKCELDVHWLVTEGEV